MPRYDVSGKVALVTGAARGIGFETARLLAERGAAVTVLDLDDDASKAAAAVIGRGAAGLGADVTDRDAMETAVDEVVERCGGLDIIVANAGVAPPTATMRVIDPEAFERILEIDLLGVWRSVRPALQQIAERQGQVVVVSSVYAWVNGVMNAPYAMAKAGVEAMGRALRTELSIHGASATVAHFGFIDTRMVQDAFADDLVANGVESRFPKLAVRRLHPRAAAAGIVNGIEKRAPRVIVPPWWKAWFAARGILNPILDRLMLGDETMVETIRGADVEERSALRGGLDRTAGRD